MRINGENAFQFNPFTIHELTNEQMKLQYESVMHQMTYGDTPFEIANDIDCYANMGYIIGVMIARYTEEVSNFETQLKVEFSNRLVSERNQWLREHTGEKAPAMEYFNARVTSMLMEQYQALNKKEANLKQFKYTYDSVQDKQNALKKVLDAVKFDVLNR